jgi:hypothetical protein
MLGHHLLYIVLGAVTMCCHRLFYILLCAVTLLPFYLHYTLLGAISYCSLLTLGPLNSLLAEKFLMRRYLSSLSLTGVIEGRNNLKPCAVSLSLWIYKLQFCTSLLKITTSYPTLSIEFFIKLCPHYKQVFAPGV